MNKQTLFQAVMGLCTILLAAAACAGPIPPGGASTLIPTVETLTVAPTSGVLTTTTVAAATVPPPTLTQVPATITPAAGTTATATLSPGPLSETDLKYVLINKFGELFFCDPDMYPVARGDQAAMAAQSVPAIKQGEPEKYLGILKHLGVAPAATLNGDQTVAVYQEYKRLNAIAFSALGDLYKFALRVPDKSGKGNNGFAIEGTISRLGVITVTKNEPAFLTCPICLASDAQIDTPAGAVPVTALHAGMAVWTLDAAGNRVVAIVEQTAYVAVPSSHQIVRLQLDDGRELRVSPGHPTADGRHVGDLVHGDSLDGARVVSAAREAYADGATYDLLPSGDTGTYWANGILLASTLR
jgi:Hint domain